MSGWVVYLKIAAMFHIHFLLQTAIFNSPWYVFGLIYYSHVARPRKHSYSRWNYVATMQMLMLLQAIKIGLYFISNPLPLTGRHLWYTTHDSIRHIYDSIRTNTVMFAWLDSENEVIALKLCCCRVYKLRYTFSYLLPVMLYDKQQLTNNGLQFIRTRDRAHK